MAGFIGYTVSNEIYDFLYRGQAITIGANLYLRLLVAASSRSGGGTETNYTGYSRLILPRTSPKFSATANGRIANNVVLEFGSPTSVGNGNLVYFDVVDTASGAFTKIYNAGPILPAKAVQIGKPPRFRVGSLVFTI
jgi:hypothetical protein